MTNTESGAQGEVAMVWHRNNMF